MAAGALPDEVMALLLPDERVLAHESVAQFGQASAVGTGPPSADVSFHLDPVLGFVDVNHDWVAAKVAGLSAGGAIDSLGHRLDRAISTSADTRLLVTDRRLAVHTATFPKLTSSVPEHALPFAVQRHAVADARLAPRLLQHGRLHIAFVDGSWVMVMAGMLLAFAARRLLRALDPATIAPGTA